MNSDKLHFWAKTTPDGRPGISVRDHCLNVGCVAEALIQRLPLALQKLLPPGAVTLAALHDIGKISPGFQQKCEVWVQENAKRFKKADGYEGNHAWVSQCAIRQELSGGRLLRLAEAIGAHHGRVQGNSDKEQGDEEWTRARKELASWLQTKEVFGANPSEDPHGDAEQWLLAGLISVADWIGSDEDEAKFPNRRRKDDEALPPKEAIVAHAKKILEGLRLVFTAPSSRPDFQAVFPRNPEPRPLQQAVMRLAAAPGIYVLEDEMGSGKTEAALWLAKRLWEERLAHGLYFALPTRVTSDKIHSRVREFLDCLYPPDSAGVPGQPIVPLIHGQAWLAVPNLKPTCKVRDENEESIKQARAWFASSRTGLLAPCGVGTVDQALMGIIAVKWFFVRQFALAGKVVILDEVHSYDLYTGALLQKLVQRLRELRATVVVLSATLTARQRAALLGVQPEPNPEQVPYPRISAETDAGPLRESPKPWREDRSVRVHWLGVESMDDRNETNRVAKLVVRLAKQGRCVLWIRNTVKQAQDSFDAVKGSRCERHVEELGLLHSRFPAWQRASTKKHSTAELKQLGLHEELWLRRLAAPNEQKESPDRPRSAILVSTQVVEQSVDIDADVLITDLAPTDMLLQRIGRLHRHARDGRTGKPHVFVVCPRLLLGNLDALTAEPVREKLGPVGRVYAPFVLMRTVREWRRQARRALRLPQGIRPLLEATYAESTTETGEAWHFFDQRLAARREKLKARADLAANVRGQPLAEDREGVGTRYSEMDYVNLLIVRGHGERGDGTEFQLQLATTSARLTVNAFRFNLDVARHLHRNVVRIPRWWWGDKKTPVSNLPPALAPYFHEPTLWARRYIKGKDATQPEELLLLSEYPKADVTPPVIGYNLEQGVWLKAPHSAKLPTPDEDEYEFQSDD